MTPLENPLAPKKSTFLTKLVRTRRRLRELAGHTSATPAHWHPDLPTVSVMVITYNHERYIGQALDSILSQRGEFSLEINVIDDASTDGTQAVVRQYEERHPGVINCYFNPTNVGHIATQLNTIRGFRTLRGKYFALLEGDDYWTDDEKLAKQIAFLESHEDFVACAHNTMKVFDDNSRPPEHFLPFKAFGRDTAKLEDLVTMAGVFHLSSILYRNVFGCDPPPCLSDPYSCEVTINMVYGLFGKFYCIDSYMSAYRVHGTGVFSTRSVESVWKFHLGGFRHFSLYLGRNHWQIFARALAGFSRYVLNAPTSTKEVSSLTFGTKLLFWSHYLVARAVHASFRGPQIFRARFLRPRGNQ